MRPTLTATLTDTAIRQATSGGAYVRGAEYARQGRVTEVTFDANTMTLSAVIRGSGHRSYSTEVQVSTGGVTAGAVEIGETWCSCPVGFGCKHAAALMLVARASSQPAHTPAPAVYQPTSVVIPTWERHVANLLDGMGNASPQATTPIALEFELTLPRASVYAGRTPYDLPARLGIRPVTWGRSGKWVRSDISWDRLPYVGSYGGYPPAHLELLQELVRLSASDYLYRRTATIDLSTVSRGLWPLLDRAGEIGLPLLMASRGREPVVVRAEPATARLDLTRPAPDADLLLRAEVRAGEQSLDVSSVGFLGTPAHGCFTLPAGDGDATTLIRFDRPLASALQRFLENAGEVRIPAGDADRFVADYYPRLRQTTTISSDDGSVLLPVVSGPRLVLTVEYSGVSTATLTWSFRYDVDGKPQRHPLLDPAGMLGVRDLAAEMRVLNRIDLPQSPVQLTVSVGGLMRIIPTLRLTGMQTVAFTREALPALRQLPDVEVEVVGDPPDFRLADSAPQIAVSATDRPDADWFDLGVTVTVDGHDVAFADLFAALAAGESHLLLDNGTYFPLDDPAFASLARLIDEARALNDQPSGGLTISPFQAGLWEELVGLGVVDQQSNRWASTVEGLLHLEKVPEPDLPADLCAELRPYQLHGYRWLRFLQDHQLGGILADDMGLGKTVQTLALVSAMRAEARADALGDSGACLGGGAYQRRRQLGGRGGPLHSRTAGGDHRRYRAQTVGAARRARGRRRPCRHVVHAVPHRRGALPSARLVSPGARRSPVRQEPSRQGLPVRPQAVGAVQTGDHRHATREQLDGPVVAAVHRGAWALPSAEGVCGAVRQADRAR